MINKDLYPYIFKRKSFHLFRGVGSDKIDPAELKAIEDGFKSFETPYPDIKTDIRIVPAEKVHFKRDAEYCILIYSEKKENYLLNAGYIGQQLDLFLVSKNIGSLWFGIGKPDIAEYNGLDFVIMIAIHKVNDASKYRKDMFKSKRKPVNEIWEGDTLGIAEIARFSPSACNSQPWIVKNENDTLSVFRYKKSGKIGILPKASITYFNRIDIGIFLCILEICLSEKNIEAHRTMYPDNSDGEYTKVAEYKLS